MMLRRVISSLLAGVILAVWVPADAQEVLVRNASVISMQPGEAEIWPETSVLIRDGVINRIYRGEHPPVLPSVQVIDGTGQTLIPGLIDMHVHIWDSPELLANLSYGVTTVRNASGMPFLLDYSDRIAAGILEGPRLLTSGPILNGPGPNEQINHQIVNNDAEARRAVRDQYAQGYRRVKIYSNLSQGAYQAILQEARQHGMRIMGHTPEGKRSAGIPFERPFEISFSSVLNDGWETIEHLESIVWHALADQRDERKARELAQQIAAAGVAIDPTLVAHRNLQLMARTHGAYQDRQGAQLLNPFVRQIEQENYARWAAQSPDTRAEIDVFYGRVLKIFIEEGVSVVAGSDSGIFVNVPGLSLIDELALFLEAGVSAADTLRAATETAAAVLGLQDHAGRIQEGYEADLVLVPGNPLENIRILETPTGVMRRGRWYDEAAILDLRERAAQGSIERTRRQVFDAMAAQGSPIPSSLQ